MVAVGRVRDIVTLVQAAQDITAAEAPVLLLREVVHKDLAGAPLADQADIRAARVDIIRVAMAAVYLLHTMAVAPAETEPAEEVEAVMHLMAAVAVVVEGVSEEEVVAVAKTVAVGILVAQVAAAATTVQQVATAIPVAQAV